MDTAINLTFSAAFAGQADQAQARRFSGIAYSGGMVPGYWGGDIAIDLAGVKIPDGNLPVLDGHSNDLAAVVGKGRVTLANDALLIDGELADTDAGHRVAALAASGVPLQLSVGLYQVKSEEFKDKKSVSVNGRQMELNALIKSAVLREVSFTPLGADPATSVSIFKLSNNHESDTMTDELNEKIAQLEADNAKLVEMLANAETALAAERAERRKEEVQTLFAAIGREFSDESAAHYMLGTMDAATFAAVKADLMAVKPAQAAAPAPAPIDPELMTEQAAGGDEQINAGFAAPVDARHNVDGDRLELHKKAVSYQHKHPGVSYLDAIAAVHN